MAVVQYTFTHKQYTERHKQYIEEHNNLWECGPCPVLARFTMAFALQLRKKHGKTSVRVRIEQNIDTQQHLNIRILLKCLCYLTTLSVAKVI